MRMIRLTTDHGPAIIDAAAVQVIAPAVATNPQTGAQAIMHGVSSILVGGVMVPVRGTPDDVAARLGITAEPEKAAPPPPAKKTGPVLLN